MPDTYTEQLPIDAAYQGEVVLRRDLGINFDEPTGINYLETPLRVFRTETADGDRFDVSVDHEPLNGSQLFDFLKQAAPGGHNDTVPGVIDDWRIIDDPTENDKKLINLHHRLGSAWNEFVLSQPAFIATLRDAVVPDFRLKIREENHQILPELDGLNFSSNSIHYSLLNIIGSSLTDGLALLDATNTGISDVIYGLIARQLNIRCDNPKKHVQVNDRTRPMLEARFQNWGTKRRLSLISDALTMLGPDAPTKITRELRDIMYEFVILPDGKTRLYPRPFLAEGEALKKAYDQRYVVRKDNFVADAIEVKSSKGAMITYLVPHSIRRYASNPLISPLIAWERSGDGGRRLIIERSQDGSEPVHYRDGVLGAVALAYFSPEARADEESWPLAKPIGARRAQGMGAAQVPVLALMSEANLLTTDFIEAAEAAS